MNSTPATSFLLEKMLPLAGVLLAAILLVCLSWQFEPFADGARADVRPGVLGGQPGALNPADQAAKRILPGTASPDHMPVGLDRETALPVLEGVAPDGSLAGETVGAADIAPRSNLTPLLDRSERARAILLSGDGHQWLQASARQRHEICDLAAQWLGYAGTPAEQAQQAELFGRQLQEIYQDAQYVDVKLAAILPLLHAVAERDQERE